MRKTELRVGMRGGRNKEGLRKILSTFSIEVKRKEKRIYDIKKCLVLLLGREN